MHIILGGTGRVGSAVAETLIRRGESVTIITRDASKSDHWEKLGARTAVADIADVSQLKDIFRTGESLFLLNPPAMPFTDIVAEERNSLANILHAIDGSGLKRIVAQSTYGAQPGDHIGDLGVLYEMELALARRDIPYALVRGAYYMSNWDAYLQPAAETGELPTLFPPDFKIPMVAPEDLGAFAAGLMTGFEKNREMHYVEGPEQYSAADVARAFSHVLGRSVTASEIPQENWQQFLTGAGFSAEAAQSLGNMTRITMEKEYEVTLEPYRGSTTLEAHIRKLAANT